MGLCLPQGRILITSTISVLINDRRFKCLSKITVIILAWQGLNSDSQWCLLFQDTPPPVRPSPISTSQREPLSLLSQNTPDLHPYQESPPPYLTQPEFRPKFLSKQGYSSSTPHYGNTPRALTIPDNDLTIDNTTNGLLADLTYGSLDGTMARTHMSLNSSGGGSRNYLAEEAELANLLKKLDLAFPGDVTMSQTGEW